MIKDDILRMARAAGFVLLGRESANALERFAALVAAAEREACAKVSEKHSYRSDDMGTIIGRAIRARNHT